MDEKSAPAQAYWQQSVGERLKWGVQRRLEFIDFRLFWYGRINRADLMSRFNISAQQASTDLDKYAEHAPQNLEYDRVLRTFVRGKGFTQTFSKGMENRYLMQVQALHFGWLDPSQTWLDERPPSDFASLLHAKVDGAVLMAVNDAISNNLLIEVEYWTMSGKPAARRKIAPHAIAYSDRRWHARCWDEENGDFRDFNLTRMADPKNFGPSPVDSGRDLEWHTFATMRLEVNPKFPEAKKAAVRREYGIDGDLHEIKTRLALLFYYMQVYDLTGQPEDPIRQPFVLLNADQLEELRQSARRMSVVALQGGSA